MLSTFRFLSFIVGAVAFYLAGSYYLHLAFISIGLVVPTIFSNGNDTLSTIVALLIYWQVGVPYLTFVNADEKPTVFADIGQSQYPASIPLFSLPKYPATTPLP